jgi:hypothetical protein
MPHRHQIVAASVAGLGLTVAAALGGCGGGAKFVARGSTGPSAAASPGSTAASPGGSASAGAGSTPGTHATGTETGTAGSTSKPSSGSGSSGSSTKGTTKCTVSRLELFHALTDDGAMYQALGAPPGIGSPVCVPGYAMARATASTKNADRAEILFKYTASTKTWKPVAGGTAVDCSAFVTSAEAKKLPGCVTG